MKYIKMPPEKYHADRTAVSKSWLDKIHQSPAHLQAYLRGEMTVESQRMEFGSLVHAFVLEPDTVNSRYAIIPSINRRTKAGLKVFEEASKSAEAHGQDMVDEESWARAKRIRDSVFANKTASTLFKKGESEQSIFWDNSDTGEKCKARADWVRGDIIMDLKTTRDASPDGFGKSIANFRYHVQSAHYRDGFEAGRFVWVAVEIDPPYAVAVYIDGDEIHARGDGERLSDLRLYAECKASDKWPGYPDEVQNISLPRWYR